MQEKKENLLKGDSYSKKTEMNGFSKAAFLAAFLFVFSFIETKVSAHDDDADILITANPIDLVNGFINFEIEAELLPFMTLHAGPNFMVWDGVWDGQNGSVFAFGPEVGARFYPLASAPYFLWVGPFAGLAYVRVTRDGEDARAAGFYAGGMVGSNFILGDVFVISLGAGLGYHELSEIIEGERTGLRGLSPRFRLGLGFAF